MFSNLISSTKNFSWKEYAKIRVLQSSHEESML